MFKNYEPNQYYKDIETTFCQLEKLDKYGIDHTEEVVIGSGAGYYLSYQDRCYSM